MRRIFHSCQPRLTIFPRVSSSSSAASSAASAYSAPFSPFFSFHSDGMPRNFPLNIITWIFLTSLLSTKVGFAIEHIHYMIPAYSSITLECKSDVPAVWIRYI